MANLEPIYELKCSCNSYPWGRVGKDSLCAKLCEKQPGWIDQKDISKPFKAEEGKPYAEMWMGTYPVLPSYLAATGEKLQDFIDTHPDELVGKQVQQKFGHSKLPYLPKVLSIAKALPLQLHPNKDLATKLHEMNPDKFTDPNHKPEIAVALTEFEAFCGFKPLAQIEKLLSLDALKKYMPAVTKPNFDDQQLKGVVKNMLQADDQTVKETYNNLTSASTSDLAGEDYILKLAPRLAKQYSESDPGILVALITMNYLVLQPGESIYVPTDGIHAYLSGDIIECMARSNNVLSTGLCPRADRDNVDLFCSCLTFIPHSVEECKLERETYGNSGQGKTVLFNPPMSEFNATETRLQQGEKETLKAVQGPTIILVSQGGAKLKANDKSVDVKEGGCYFVAQGVDLSFEAGSDGLVLHGFYVE